MSKKRGSGESRMDVSVGELAVVGMMSGASPLVVSPRSSFASRGLSRRTSSRRTCLMRSPLLPPQPEYPPSSGAGPPILLADRP